MNEYILVERHSRPGKNGVTMWRFTWYCLEDGLLYETTVDNTYANFRRRGWDHLATDPRPWGVYTGLRRTSRTTREGLPVITADSAFSLEHRCDSQAQAIEIVACHCGQTGRSNQFEELFQ